jgi:hypothetical protein
MIKILLVLQLLIAFYASGQADNTRWLRAFPITDYIVELNDSVKIVQVELPNDLSFQDKQFALLRGVYHDVPDDTVQKGYGRCHLIKGNYYYFAITHHKTGKPPIAGDLLYTFMNVPEIYKGKIPALASHFIRLQDVYGGYYYDRYDVMRQWTKAAEGRLLDSMAAGIRFTANYFLEQDSSMNQLISAGFFAGRLLLNVMKECTPADLEVFLHYMIARPRLYAGREWKVPEIFATWLTAGAPGKTE